MLDPSEQSSRQSQPRLHRLLSSARTLELAPGGGSVLPLSSDTKILPGKSVVVRAWPQVPHSRMNRLLVTDPKKWRILSLRTAPRIGGCQVLGDHPALSDPGPESVALLPFLPVDDGVSLEVEYVGPEASGERFVACLCIWCPSNSAVAEDPSGSPEVGVPSGSPEVGVQGHRQLGSTGQPDRRGTASMSLLVGSRPVAPGERIYLPLPKRAHDFYDATLALRVEEPTHWLVSDVSIGGETLLVEFGDLPGELLADRPGSAPLSLGHLRVKEDLIVQATYIGPLPSASLSYEVSGSEMPRGAASDIIEASEGSAFLPMSSGGPLICGAGSEVWARVGVPRGYAFLTEKVILRDPDKWVVEGARVGNRSQFAASGAVPGTIFWERASGCRLDFEMVPGGGVDLVLCVKYIGPNKAGDRFICGAVGRIVRLPLCPGQ